jgi:hypothetical protein
MSAEDLSPLRIGVLMTFVGLGSAAIMGVVAVIDASNVASAFGTGLGIAATIFLAGATIACALACLVRGRVEILALAAVAAAGLAVDLFVFAIWLEIDDETYGKIASIAFVWTFFGLIGLGLALAVHARETLARVLYIGAMAAAVVAGLILTWLIATAGGSITPTSAVGIESITDESLLRPLAVSLVLLAALWFSALAASRLERL